MVQHVQLISGVPPKPLTISEISPPGANFMSLINWPAMRAASSVRAQRLLAAAAGLPMDAHAYSISPLAQVEGGTPLAGTVQEE